jgi:hypothetical protein
VSASKPTGDDDVVTLPEPVEANQVIEVPHPAMGLMQYVAVAVADTDPVRLEWVRIR